MVAMGIWGNHTQPLLGNFLKNVHLETAEDSRYVGQHSGATMKRQTVRMWDEWTGSEPWSLPSFDINSAEPSGSAIRVLTNNSSNSAVLLFTSSLQKGITKARSSGVLLQVKYESSGSQTFACLYQIWWKQVRKYTHSVTSLARSLPLG